MTGAAVPDATRRRVLVPFAVVTLIWGSTFLVIRGQLGVVPPGWSVTYRFVIAAVAMFAYARATRVRLRLTRREQALAAAVGIAQFVLNFNFVYRAEHYVTSGLVAVMFALLIVPNAVFGRIFLGQRLPGAFLAGSVVALLGVALLFRHEMLVAAAGSRGVALGIGLTALAVLSASASNVLQASDRARDVPMTALVAWAMFWGVLVNAALAWVTVGPPVVEMRAAYWLGTAWLALAGSTLAFPLYYGVIRAIGAARAAYSNVIVPVIAMSLSTMFEGYRWSPAAAVGGVLVGAGLVIALRARTSIVPPP